MEISDIKERLKIEKVLSHCGLQANRNHMLKCPFHEEKEPSLKIYPQTNTFNFFGCKANGDTIEFIQLKASHKLPGCSKHKALLRAKELLNISEIPKSLAISGKNATELMYPVESKELLHRVKLIEISRQQGTKIPIYS